VEGFGIAKTHALRGWRLDIESEALSSIPPLPDSAASAIRNRYTTRRRDLENQLASARQREQLMRDAVLEQFQLTRASNDEQERQTLANFDQEGRSIRDKHQPELKRIDSDYRQLKAKITSVLKEHDRQLSDVKLQKTQQQFEACKLQRQIDQHRRLSWSRYLARSIGIGKAA